MNRKEESKGNDEHFLEFGELQLNSVNEALDSLDQSKGLGVSMSNVNEYTDADYRCFNAVDRSIDVQPLRSIASYGTSSTFDLSTQNLSVFNKAESSNTAIVPPVKIEKLKTSTNTKTKSSRPIFAPDEPFYVAPSTHFVTNKDLADIKILVEDNLNNQEGVSFQFFGTKCRWEAVYLVGSSRCKFEISVYKRKDGIHIIEGNRLSGDGFAFVSIYKSIRDLFIESTDPLEGRRFDSPTLQPLHTDLNVIRNSISNIVRMANCGVCEAELSAAQIFCDICSDASKHDLIVECGGIPALLKLLEVEFQSCNQHAVCALANLSTSPSCQRVLMNDEKFLQTLFSLCSDVNSDHNNIEMRRECARLLANVSGGETGAKQVVENAGVDNVTSWLESVDGFKDDKLRIHATRAKISLAECCT